MELLSLVWTVLVWTVLASDATKWGIYQYKQYAHGNVGNWGQAGLICPLGLFGGLRGHQKGLDQYKQYAHGCVGNCGH